MSSPPMKKQTREIQPLTANCSKPLIPWPLGQPSAIRAPNIRMMPPKKATNHRLNRSGPNRFFHSGRNEATLKFTGEPCGDKGTDEDSQNLHPLPVNDRFLLDEIGHGGDPFGNEDLFDHARCPNKGGGDPEIFPAVRTANQLTIPISAPAT